MRAGARRERAELLALKESRYLDFLHANGGQLRAEHARAFGRGWRSRYLGDPGAACSRWLRPFAAVNSLAVGVPVVESRRR
jgi:hypothetical protein